MPSVRQRIEALEGWKRQLKHFKEKAKKKAKHKGKK